MKSKSPAKPRPFHRGKLRSAPLPRTRDPLINCPLKSLGVDEQGIEKFWISSVNFNVGSTGLVIDERGNVRKYSFPYPHDVFYNAHVDGDHLWLCGRLEWMVRLHLPSGKFEAFPTGAPRARVFEGVAFDRESGKLFAVAKPYWGLPGLQPTAGVSFDTRACKTVQTHKIPIAETMVRCAFDNDDGTHSILAKLPGQTLLRWNPKNETIDPEPLTDKGAFDDDVKETFTSRLIRDNAGRVYFPGLGWRDPVRRAFVQDGPRPELEMCWFARLGDTAFGILEQGSDATVHAWDMTTGRVRAIAQVPDAVIWSFALTRSGKILCVNVFGMFLRFDAKTGELELTKRLDTDQFVASLTFGRIDRDRVVGATYISSRFWEANLKTKRGADCGRAMAAWGQISLLKRVAGKIYFAAYTGAQLYEYDPALPPRFPENPRLVARTPLGRRPVTIDTDGRHVFCSFNAWHGEVGSALMKYDTKTGESFSVGCQLKLQEIDSIRFDKKSKSLICGTRPHDDGKNTERTISQCYLARVSAGDLSMIGSALAPAGTENVAVLGPLDSNRWLCGLRLSENGLPLRLAVAHLDDFASFTSAPLEPLPEKASGSPIYAGRPGRFLLNIDDRLELWDMRRRKSLGVILQPFDPARFDGYLLTVEGDDVLVLRGKEVIVLEGALTDF